MTYIAVSVLSMAMLLCAVAFVVFSFWNHRISIVQALRAEPRSAVIKERETSFIPPSARRCARSPARQHRHLLPLAA